ncbi:NACHT domain-containing protein [Myxococcota bacterium]|nr:NACHT domain-containing protein [Myxococcota bacterium]
MPVVSSTLVQLLQALFDQGALSRALEREDWSAKLLPQLTPVEHTTPDAWFHGLVRLVTQHGTMQRLFELMRRERPGRVAEIDAVAQSFASTTMTAGAAALRARYATLLRGQLDKLPDVLRIVGGPRTVEAVYVEVKLAAHEHELDYGIDAPYAKGREAARRFLEGGDDLRGRVPLTQVLSHPHRRWGLLGDPGSGKSTLLRHVAIELLGDPDGSLPIYLKVADLSRGLSEAVETMCLAFHDTELISFVLGEAQAGRATLLIDGLDEAEDLPTARRWVSGVASKVGHSQIVVASRPIGYTEPAADFRTLTLCPLAAAEQHELLTRWVKDPARAERALERLSRAPRLRRLVENPLLLTLVGVLLRKGQDVPSRRSDLYERALKLLLTRDHDGEDAAPFAPMREPGLTLELLSWAALRLHGLEGEAYQRDALIAALEADPRRAVFLAKH